MKKCLVVSAVNFSEGGPLTILRDCLISAARTLPPEWEIIALVHDQRLINEPRVHLIAVPDAKSSWLRRLHHEWFGFRRISQNFKPDLWLSLHDITPRVTARRQAVYCHNPSPFYKLTLRETWLEPKLWLFNQLYRYLYQVFIRRNCWVVVQQAWMRDSFKRLYGPLPIIVAHPSVNLPEGHKCVEARTEKVIFLYPSLPRGFKNFEVLCEAAKILYDGVISGLEIRITLRGDENRYSKWLFAKYSYIPNLHFIGLQSKEQMDKQYSNATAVVFPSKLETWGLPISEAKLYNKPLLVADMPYAHETVGTYDQVSFFKPNDAKALANLMQQVLERRWQPEHAKAIEPLKPFTHNWDELWCLLTKNL
jgi:glycosyltransferase involved in cell wall biosynthesis